MVTKQKMRTPIGFGNALTRLGKNLLILYVVFYIIELILEHWARIPVTRYFWLYPIGDPFFQIWQILTHPFFHHPIKPIGFMFSCLGFYFFAAPVEYAFGSKRFLTMFYLSALGGALCGMLFSLMPGFSAPLYGMVPSLLALIVVFGLINPEATILLMFIIPIKARYISYGTVLIVLLTFLAKINPHGAYQLGGILFGYLYTKGLGTLFDPKLIYLKYQKWKLMRKRSHLSVIDGQKKKKKDDDAGPTYH